MRFEFGHFLRLVAGMLGLDPANGEILVVRYQRITLPPLHPLLLLCLSFLELVTLSLMRTATGPAGFLA